MTKDQVDKLSNRIMDALPRPQDCLCTVITRTDKIKMSEEVRQILRDALGA